jgi:hypothetical protein
LSVTHITHSFILFLATAAATSLFHHRCLISELFFFCPRFYKRKKTKVIIDIVLRMAERLCRFRHTRVSTYRTMKFSFVVVLLFSSLLFSFYNQPYTVTAHGKSKMQGLAVCFIWYCYFGKNHRESNRVVDENDSAILRRRRKINMKASCLFTNM